MIMAMGAIKSEPQKSLSCMLDNAAHPIIGIKRIPIAHQITSGMRRALIIRIKFIPRKHFVDHPVITFIGV